MVVLSTITVAPEAAGTHTTFDDRAASTVLTRGKSAGVRVVIPMTMPVRAANPMRVSRTRRIIPPVHDGQPKSHRWWGRPGPRSTPRHRSAGRTSPSWEPIASSAVPQPRQER